MKCKLYWGLGILAILLIGMSLGTLLIRPTDTEPKNVYIDRDPSQEVVDQMRQQASKKNPPTARPGYQMVQHGDHYYEVPISAQRPSDTSLNTLDTNSKQQTQAAETTEVAVSRFGFGPYPKTPEGWAPIPWHLFKDPNFELMTRVRIKYLEQGEPIVGVTMDKGKVYPIINGICYVKWKTVNTPFGTVKQITRRLGNIVDGDRLDAIQEANGGILTVADVPADIKLIPYDEGGVDPYTFLSLR